MAWASDTHVVKLGSTACAPTIPPILNATTNALDALPPKNPVPHLVFNGNIESLVLRHGVFENITFAPQPVVKPNLKCVAEPISQLAQQEDPYYRTDSRKHKRRMRGGVASVPKRKCQCGASLRHARWCISFRLIAGSLRAGSATASFYVGDPCALHILFFFGP